MGFQTTDWKPSDSTNIMLGKLLQKFGGSPLPGDGTPTLLRKILAIASAAEAATDYLTDAELTAALASYVTDAELTAALVPFSREFWVDSGAMIPSGTNGAAGATYTPAGAGGLRTDSYLFDDTTSESVQFKFALPWEVSTLKFIVYFTSATAAGGVVWGLSSVAVKTGDVLGGAFGTEVVSVGTMTGAEDLIKSAETTMTIGGAPAKGDLVVCKLTRLPGNASDILVGDSRLLGVQILY